MTGEAIVPKVVAALESAGAAYMLVGSLAASFYGLSRSTKDADFVVQFEPGSLSAVLTQLGPLFKLDRLTKSVAGCVQADTLRESV